MALCAPPSLGELTQSIVEVTDLFSRWKAESPQINIPKFRKELRMLTGHVGTARDMYLKALSRIAAESEVGVCVAQDFAYLLGQLIAKAPPAEVKDLLDDLKVRIEALVEAAKRLADEFHKVREHLLISKNTMPDLKDHLVDYGDAAIPADKRFIAAVCAITALVFPRVAGRARELRDATNHEKRHSAAENALSILKSFEPGLDRAIAVVGRLHDDWHQLQKLIEGAIMDPAQLMGSTARLKKTQATWGKIEQTYKEHGSQAGFAKGRLELM